MKSAYLLHMSAHACPRLSSWRLCQVSASCRRANGKLRAALLQRTLPAWTEQHIHPNEESTQEIPKRHYVSNFAQLCQTKHRKISSACLEESYFPLLRSQLPRSVESSWFIDYLSDWHRLASMSEFAWILQCQTTVLHCVTWLSNLPACLVSQRVSLWLSAWLHPKKHPRRSLWPLPLWALDSAL